VHALREFQEQFRAALTADAAPAPLTQHIVAGQLTVERRINVYRNSMRSSLTESLRATYPAVHALVGDGFFRMLAERYMQSHPSTSGNLHTFGDAFDSFLGDLAEVRSLPYLADVARLEWCCHAVFHAAEAAPITPAELAHLDQSEFAEVCLHLHPASALVSSTYPIADIWNLAVHGDEKSGNLDISSGGQQLLVARRNMEIEFQQMTAAEYAFVSRLAQHCALADCVETAMELDPGFDVASCLARQFSLGNLVGFSISPDASHG
jgi:hypothetical protein